MLGLKGMAIAGVVVLMMGLALWHTQGKLDDANKTIGNQSGVIIGLEKDIVLQIRLAENNKKHNKAFEKQERKHDANLQEKENEYRAQAQSSFADSQADPDAFDHRVTAIFIDFMCGIQSASDPDTKQACVDSSTEAQINGKPFTITITEKTVKEYERGCEIYRDAVADLPDGEELAEKIVRLSDLCHYSITGFTPEQLFTVLLPYFLSVEAEIQGYHRYIATLGRLIEAQGDGLEEEK